MDLSMEEIIYTIVRIEEEDFGCEGRPDGAVPEVSVYLKSENKDSKIVVMEDSVMYTRQLDVGSKVIIGSDGSLYHPDCVMAPVDMEKDDNSARLQNEWMEHYMDAVDELDETL
ncbi:MAG: hypothetical protein PUC12_05950 [Clostridiales bacterium]|nr:hypothetical protein [Clostridiales bacterium]